MALCRPDKDAPRRSLFNWAHRSLGIISLLMSGKKRFKARFQIKQSKSNFLLEKQSGLYLSRLENIFKHVHKRAEHNCGMDSLDIFYCASIRIGRLYNKK